MSITAQSMLGNVSNLKTLLSNKQAFRTKDAKEARASALNLAHEVIFSIFDKKSAHYGGDLVGSAAKAVLKARNGGKNVKARCVSEELIGSITTDEMMAALTAYRDTRKGDLDVRAATMRNAHVQVADETTGKPIVKKLHSDEAIKADIDKRLADLAKAFEAAQAYINIYWAQIPSAMALLRYAGNGTIKTDDGEVKPTALAFEMVLLNRAETAKQFAGRVTKMSL